MDVKEHIQNLNNMKKAVQTTELIRTSKSWDGMELPDYPQGRPELVVMKYEIPAGQKLGWHHHPVMNHGILVQGELTIVSLDGTEKVVHEGEAVVEMVNTIHHGENRGTKPVILYMFYFSQEGLPLSVQHPEIPMSTKKYSLGIAFSGGGAKGAAHCGALQALKEYGIKPDVVSGTSVGALVATFYSSGFSPKQMIETFRGMNFFKDIVAPSLPKGGLFDSRPLQELIRKLLPYNRLEDLPIPTFIVASDMEHGVSKVFSKGEIAPRVVASCSMPVIFQPICINGVHYVDGGTFQNLPVSAIRQKCDKVIALNLNHLEAEKHKNNLISVAYRAFMMMMVSNVAADSAQADLSIDLDTYGCMAHDVSRIEELFFRGYESTVKVLEENGYQRVMPKETINFPKKRRRKNNANNPDEVFRNTIERGLATIRAIKKGKTPKE